MANPLVIAYHLIWTGYGWWLPNNPAAADPIPFAMISSPNSANYTTAANVFSLPPSKIREFQDRAEDFLKHPRLSFDDEARQVIATALAQTIADERYTCYACVIMPDHVHILIRKHKHLAEEMIENLMDRSRRQLCEVGYCARTHPVWSGGLGWKVCLDHPDEIRRTMAYIKKNPLAIGQACQEWPFVITYDGWPLHPGHSPLSPYVKALKAAGRYP